mgnify:CR=1 FL=1
MTLRRIFQRLLRSPLPPEAADAPAESEQVIALQHYESSLRESEEKFRRLFESSRDAIMILYPPNWNFIACNPATVQLFGARDEAHFTSLGPGDVSPEYQPDGELSMVKAPKAIEAAMREGFHLFEWMHKRVGGATFLATVQLTRITLQGVEGLQATGLKPSSAHTPRFNGPSSTMPARRLFPADLTASFNCSIRRQKRFLATQPTN